MELGALPYHIGVAEHLGSVESGLWAWFESDQVSKRHAEMVKLELLKSVSLFASMPRKDWYWYIPRRPLLGSQKLSRAFNGLRVKEPGG